MTSDRRTLPSLSKARKDAFVRLLRVMQNRIAHNGRYNGIYLHPERPAIVGWHYARRNKAVVVTNSVSLHNVMAPYA